MSDEVERGNGLVPVQYHQFDISDEDGPAGPDLGRDHNGLVQVADGTLTVMTGIHTGDVEVTVTLHPVQPPPDSDPWQEIVEISAHSASGDLMVRGIMDDLDEDLPVLSFNGPGDYRLRIHARGRDTARRPGPRHCHRVVPHPDLAGPHPRSNSAPPERHPRGHSPHPLTPLPLCPSTDNRWTGGRHSPRLVP